MGAGASPGEGDPSPGVPEWLPLTERTLKEGTVLRDLEEFGGEDGRHREEKPTDTLTLCPRGH